MQTNSVSNNNNINNNINNSVRTARTDGTRRSGQAAGMERDAFMQMLMMQVRAQDPMSPMDSAQFFDQLAQLSVLEQLWTMNDLLSRNDAAQQLVNGASLIGRYVEANTPEQGRISGLVDQVRMASGQVWLQIGDHEVHLDQVLTVQ